MKTLYVSDLDGTLLTPDQRVTPHSARIINDLIDKGLLFSLNTARSIMGAGILNLRDIHFTIPLILMNGALFYDITTGKIADWWDIPGDMVDRLVALCMEHGKAPLIYRVKDRENMDVTYTNPTCPWEWDFLKSRSKQYPHCFRQIAAYEKAKPAIYLTMQDTYACLKSLSLEVDKLPGISYVLYEDNYHTDNWYLEIFSAKGGKGNGLKHLQELVGADRTVAFGDNFNDLPMLEMADVALVMGNGQPAVQKAAHQVIGTNEEDGVAEYLRVYGQW